MTVVSTIVIAIEHYLQDDLCAFRNIASIGIELIIVVLYLGKLHGLFYILSAGRIFILREVTQLWVRIWNVIWKVS